MAAAKAGAAESTATETLNAKTILLEFFIDLNLPRTEI
jgi:hypothetical protein